ncbi:hypothetical protein LCGC14_2540030 [marine sediment metagenome]|uniref:GIY-YIG domain-containing protein n=1 Tax=marine sediment metagenome TaxID=412755 RepID=A0A0F9BDS1_9ZZZZ
MGSGIYKIANTVTGDLYIGSAVNTDRRIYRHKYLLNKQEHHNPILQNVYNKHGLNNLLFEIIERVEDKNDLLSREQFYLDKLNPKYNICKIAGSSLGLKHSEETKKKMSESHKNMSEDTRHKISLSQRGNKNHMFGKKHTKKTIQKMSKSFKIKNPWGELITGKNLEQFCRENNLHSGHMSEVLRGKFRHHKGWTRV